MRPLEDVRAICVGPKKEFGDIRGALENWGCDIKTSDTISDLHDALKMGMPDLIFVWLFPETRDLLDAFPVAKEFGPEIPVVAVTDAMNLDLYLEALKRGAFDAVGVPLNQRELLRITRSAVKEHIQHAVAKAA